MAFTERCFKRRVLAYSRSSQVGTHLEIGGRLASQQRLLWLQAIQNRLALQSNHPALPKLTKSTSVHSTCRTSRSGSGLPPEGEVQCQSVSSLRPFAAATEPSTTSKRKQPAIEESVVYNAELQDYEAAVELWEKTQSSQARTSGSHSAPRKLPTLADAASGIIRRETFTQSRPPAQRGVSNSLISDEEAVWLANLESSRTDDGLLFPSSDDHYSDLSHPTEKLAGSENFRPSQESSDGSDDSEEQTVTSGPRRNPAGVQLLSPKLHAQIFPGPPLPKPSREILRVSQKHLQDNGLSPKDAAVLPEIEFNMPALFGSNIREHFQYLGAKTAQPYLDMSTSFAQATLPRKPETWHVDGPGWRRYDYDGNSRPVENLDGEQVVCFDVEVLYKLSPYACMATAATPNAWYSWLSPAIFAEEPDIAVLMDKPIPKRSNDPSKIRSDVPSSLIPLFSDPSKPAIVVGHNVGYDRARVLDEYCLGGTGIRWLDTLSLHVATKGITSVQRPAWMLRRKQRTEDHRNRQDAEAYIREKEGFPDDLDLSADDADASSAASKRRWEDVTSSNSLAEVARLHCSIPVDKSIRSVFGQDYIRSATQLRKDLQKLLTYCANDVQITQQVLGKVLPLFLSSCPHPASFAGTLTMGSAVLPVDDSWEQYIRNAEMKYRQLEGGVKGVLWDLAYKLKARGPKEDDPWSSQLDWSPKFARWDESDGETAMTQDPAPEVHPGRSAEQPEPGSTALGSTSAPTQVNFDAIRSFSTSACQGEGSKAILADEPETIPKWLADGASRWLLHQPPGHPLGDILPLICRVNVDGFPLLESAEFRWIVKVPKDQQEFCQSKGWEGPLALRNKADLRICDDQHVFFRPDPPGSSRMNSPFTKRLFKRWASKELDSAQPELSELLVDGGKRDRLQPEISTAVMSFLRDGQSSEWGKNLDWTPVSYQDSVFRFIQESSPTKKTTDSSQTFTHGEMALATATKKATKAKATGSAKTPRALAPVWPKWFWELTSPNLSPGELDLTVRNRKAPLLLRMQWKGFPLIYTREFGWCFRVKREDAAQNPELEPTKRLVFGSRKQYASDFGAANDDQNFYFKVPHSAGEEANVGNPLAKTFLPYIENGTLSSAPAEEGDESGNAAAEAMNMNAQCSYWVSARERIMDQMAVPLRSIGRHDGTLGLILPQVITMGTVTRRAVEATWLTASNAKKTRVGSELKAMVRAPAGYSFVGADVDSEELWISSVMGDSQFGSHGATAIGWMTLEGTKAAGTDVHSTTAKILKTSRNNAKVFNYSRIYGAGVKHAVQLLLQNDPTLTDSQAKGLAEDLYRKTKGTKTMMRIPGTKVGGRKRERLTHLWHGGSESFLFNTLEKIASNTRPMTPALGCGVTDALRRKYLPDDGTFGSDYLPSRINWVVQSSGVDYLHLLIISMEYLIERFDIQARYMISVHDELRYLVKDEDALRAALAMQIANAWTRALFCYNLGIDELPQSVAFFSAVDIDHVLRKEVDVPCVTPSQPEPIPEGKCYDIESLLAATNGGMLEKAKSDNGGARVRRDGVSILHGEDDDGYPQSERPVITTTPFADPPDLKSPNHMAYLIAQASKEPKAVYRYFDMVMPELRRAALDNR